jgi:hypothetical protein
MIISEWERKENTFSLIIEVPKTASAKIIIPEDYMNSSIEMINLTTQRSVDTNIKDGAFKVKSGKYKMIALPSPPRMPK